MNLLASTWYAITAAILSDTVMLTLLLVASGAGGFAVFCVLCEGYARLLNGTHVGRWFLRQLDGGR